MQQGKVKDVCKETKSRYKMRHVQHTIFKDKVRIGMPGKDMTTREGHREKSLKVSIRIAKEFRELVMSRNSRYLKTGQNRKTVASLKKIQCTGCSEKVVCFSRIFIILVVQKLASQ